jgi:HEAT repeat protein
METRAADKARDRVCLCMAVLATLVVGSPSLAEPPAGEWAQGRDSRDRCAEATPVTEMQASLRSANPADRAQAVSRLGTGCYANAGDDALAALERDPEGSVRTAAAFTLGTLKERRAVDALLRALDDRVPNVRSGAAFALAKIVPKEVAGRLDLSLEAETDVTTRGGIVQALGQTDDAAALRPLATVLARDPNAGIRTMAAHALGGLRSVPGSAGPLCVALRSDAAVEVRQAAAQALGILGNPVALETLMSALDHDTSPRVRGVVAWALLSYRTSPGVKDALLRVQRDDTDASVRTFATRALEAIGRYH